MGSSSSAPQPSFDMGPQQPINPQVSNFDTSGNLQPASHSFQQPDFSSYITALLAKSAANTSGIKAGGNTDLDQAAAEGQQPFQGGPTPQFRTNAVDYFSSNGPLSPKSIADALMKSGAAQQQQTDAAGVPTSHPLVKATT